MAKNRKVYINLRKGIMVFENEPRWFILLILLLLLLFFLAVISQLKPPGEVAARIGSKLYDCI